MMDSGVSFLAIRVVCLKLVLCSPAMLTVALVSFAGMGFLAFYLAGKLHLFDERGHAVCSRRCIKICLLILVSRAKLGFH